MKASETPEYRLAITSLTELKEQLGMTSQVKAIAACLISVAECTLPEPVFAYVGDPQDPRDRAVVAAQTEYFRRFVEGEDINEDWREL